MNVPAVLASDPEFTRVQPFVTDCKQAPADGSAGGSRPAHLVHTVEAAVEHAVEHAVEVAERSLAARIGAGGLRVVLFTLRALMWAALAAWVVFCLTLIGLRHWWMPHVDDWRPTIEQRASDTLKQRVTIGHIDADWLGFNPRLQLTDVQLHDATGGVTLTLPKIDAVLSWTSVPTLQARVNSLTIESPEIEVRRLSDSTFRIAGVLLDLNASNADTAGLQWVLEQHRVAVRQATVHYIDEARPGADPSNPPEPIDLTEVDVLLTHGFGVHHFAVRAHPPPPIADVVDIRGWFDHPWSQPASNFAAWSGRLYARLDYIDMARLETIARQIPEPLRLQRGNGALRAWIDFSALTIQRARADLAFTDVDLKLRSDLEPLVLDSLQGRITQQAWNTGSAEGQDVTLTQLTLAGPGGLHLPPTDLSYRVSRQTARAGSDGGAAAGKVQHNEVTASSLSLADLSTLASHVPLPARVQDLIARFSLRGNLSNLRASWDDNADELAPVALQADFSHLSAAAQAAEPAVDADGRPVAGTPGFDNLSGSVDATRAGGTLVLASTDAHLNLPGILDDPQLPLDHLDAKLHWTSPPSGVAELGIDTLAAGNADLELSVVGTARSNGEVDLSGTLPRAGAAAIARYVPLAAGAGAREWLQLALRQGRVSAGSFLLRGKLDQFPFANGAGGDFQASMHVADGILDYAPSTPAHPRARPWPVMTGLDADLKFSRDELQIRGNQAAIHGVKLAGVAAKLSPIESREAHVVVSGQGDGELADLVGFVNDSPVGGQIGNFLASAQSTGPAHLQIRLDVPLNHSVDTDVAGSLQFRNNDLVLRNDIAPMTAVNGRLDFTQHGVRASGLTAGYLGGQARADLDTGTDGAVRIKVSGAATPQGLRRQIGAGVIRQVLDNSRGLTKYSAALAIHADQLELHAQSDLTGLAIDMPEPLGKVAADRMPLAVDMVPVAGASPARDSIRVEAANLLTVHLERVADPSAGGEMRIERGVVGVGAPGTLPESGLLVSIALPKLDFDRWLPQIEALSAAGEAGTAPASGTAGSANGGGPDLVAARIEELSVSGKPMHNVTLGASRATDGGWNINVEADQTSGSLHWVSTAGPAGGSQGRLTARLAHLSIPESAREPVAEVLDAPARELPELEVVADDFVLGSSKLGRLELNAQNVGSGKSRSWQVKRLLIDNPDGRITGTGVWQREPGSQARRMSMAMSLDIFNAGSLLGRFGMAGTVKNGTGRISGNLSWIGSPFSIDYPSLSGDLKLNAEKGQFLKAEAGVGRLLGVMSLQALPRRITLDFRDIFSQGFAFDSIQASARIAKGVLTTHDFKMAGVNASVVIEGDVDLQAETQNLHVLVLPQISAESASVLWATLVNPAVGVATLLGQWLLRHPLSKLLSYEYDLTGSWAEPQVKKHERPKPPDSATNAAG